MEDVCLPADKRSVDRRHIIGVEAVAKRVEHLANRYDIADKEKSKQLANALPKRLGEELANKRVPHESDRTPDGSSAPLTRADGIGTSDSSLERTEGTCMDVSDELIDLNESKESDDVAIGDKEAVSSLGSDVESNLPDDIANAPQSSNDRHRVDNEIDRTAADLDNLSEMERDTII